MLFRYIHFRNSVEITCLLLLKTEYIFYICEEGESRKGLVKIIELKIEKLYGCGRSVLVSKYTSRKQTRPLSGSLCMHPVLSKHSIV